VLGRGLLKDFPNPERIGCPGADVLKKIASHEMPLSEAEKWLNHFGSCSPCYSDFCKIQATYKRRRTRTILAIAASILVVAGIAGWALLLRQKEPSVAQTAVLDLRNRSIPRGTEANPMEPPLNIRRTATHWNIYLPLGSSEGAYEVRVLAPSGESLLTADEVAKLRDGVTSIQIQVSFSSARSGQYLLQVRKVGSEWNSYAVVLQ
jgi:hypothetical protein